jgi:hypothetical protein
MECADYMRQTLTGTHCSIVYYRSQYSIKILVGEGGAIKTRCIVDLSVTRFRYNETQALIQLVSTAMATGDKQYY